jgi:predicted nucleic acid-binding protein
VNEPTRRYVLDTSALLAFTDSEDGAEVIDALLRQAQKGELELLVSFASWMEVYYVYLQEQGRERAQLWISKLKNLPLVRMDSDEITGQIAGELKASQRMSFADAWIAALAKRHEATLVHKDPEFESVSQVIQLQALPYK